MKYFTTEWWRGDHRREDHRKVVESYEAYFAGIKQKLPVGLVELETGHSLHDAKLTEVRSDGSTGSLHITFDGWDQSLSFPVRYALRFDEVQRFHQAFAEDGEMPGDLGYTEIELHQDCVEMRMLFASATEFSILFKGFAFEVSDPKSTNRLSALTLIIPDYDEAIDYYTGTLGFVLDQDEDQGHKRWVRVTPSGGGAGFVLAEPGTPQQRAAIGQQGGGRVWLFLETDDFEADYSRLRAKDVEFEEEPRHEPYGTVAVFRDRYGNRWDLIQSV